jgi:hypothetical protein
MIYSIPAAQFSQFSTKFSQICAAGISPPRSQQIPHQLTQRSKPGILLGSDMQCVVFVEFFYGKATLVWADVTSSKPTRARRDVQRSIQL